MTDIKKKIETYNAFLKTHIDKKDFVKIYRTFKQREENISGFILSITTDFLLLQVGEDFRLDGYAIIRKDQFDSLRCNKYDKIQKKIYKAEGILDKEYGIDKPIKLKTWQDIFKDLKKLDYHVIIECEDKEETSFEIGPIKRVTKNAVSVQYYDPAGQLENKLTSTKYTDITLVKFGDNYSKTFRKYLKRNKTGL